MRLRRPIKAVVFDMDGLLVDTETVYFAAMAQAARELGHELPRAHFQTMVGLPDHQSDRRMLEAYGGAFPLDLFNGRYMELERAAVAEAARLKPGVNELLDDLDTADAVYAIATSSSHETVRAHLGASGLLPRFKAVIARGDYREGKPKPDPYLHAAEALGLAPEVCLALEDSHNGVRSAAAAGMPTVMVPDMLEATPEMEDLCQWIARDLHQVRSWLIL